MYECSYYDFFFDSFLMPLTKKGREGREGKGGVCLCVFVLSFFSLYLKYISESKEASKESLIDERTSKLLLEDGVEFSLLATV